jgi:hypothetical protein
MLPHGAGGNKLGISMAEPATSRVTQEVCVQSSNQPVVAGKLTTRLANNQFVVPELATRQRIARCGTSLSAPTKGA